MVKNIFNPSQLPAPLIYKPMNDDWCKRLSNEWWAKNYDGSLDKDILVPKTTNEEWRESQYQLFLEALKIRDKLLSFGGTQACMSPDRDDGTKILNQGQFFYGKNARMSKGAPSQCHRNSCFLWDANKDNKNCHITTGYALSEDGMWRQHSWVVVEKPRSWQIYETTKKRVAYFGYVMNYKECEKFYADCY